MLLYDDTERDFNTTTREFVIYLLLVIGLFFLSYGLISLFKKKVAFHASDYEDEVVYKVSFLMCMTSLATSIGAAFLLPISIVSNEVLLYYPNSDYINWLNGSLIFGFWNLTFLFSNLSLFILLPFAYFFSESQGFSGSNKGIKARVYETFAVLALLGLIILGTICILSAIFDYKNIGLVPIFDIGSYYLPFLYSCVSFLGVLMLLVCTPVGFAHLFTVVGRLIVNPQVYKDIMDGCTPVPCDRANDGLRYSFMSNKPPENGSHQDISLRHEEEFNMDYRNFQGKDRKIRMAKIRKNVLYPLGMIFLLGFTVMAVLMVAQNTLALVFGIKNLPIYSQKFSLGITSFSALGILGAFLEIVLILYLWCSSVVGLYALPLFCHLRPKVAGTSMTHIIGNCAVLLVLSSALPVLARTLGITNFDLLGDFGKIHWLGNFYIVVFYNVVFTVATIICLITKMTATVRQELKSKLVSFAKMDFKTPVPTVYQRSRTFSRKEE